MSRRQSPARSGPQPAVRTRAARLLHQRLSRRPGKAVTLGASAPRRSRSAGRFSRARRITPARWSCSGSSLPRRDAASRRRSCSGCAAARLPNDASVHNNYGNVLRDLGRHVSALTSYERALAIKPDYVDAHYNRAVVLQDLRRFEDAIAGYDRALAFRPGARLRAQQSRRRAAGAGALRRSGGKLRAGDRG